MPLTPHIPTIAPSEGTVATYAEGHTYLAQVMPSFRQWDDLIAEVGEMLMTSPDPSAVIGHFLFRTRDLIRHVDQVTVPTMMVDAMRRIHAAFDAFLAHAEHVVLQWTHFGVEALADALDTLYRSAEGVATTLQRELTLASVPMILTSSTPCYWWTN